MHDGAMLGAGRHPKWVSLPLHDEHRDGYRVELVQAACCASAAGRSQREREAKHGEGTGRFGGATGDPRSQGSAADEKRQAAQLAREQVFDRCQPSSVELARRRRAAAACDTVGLLDERDAHPFRSRNVGHRHQVWRSHPSPSPMAEDQGGSRFRRGMHVGSCQTVRRLELERGHSGDGCDRLREQLDVLGLEDERWAYFQDVASRARAVDEDARIAHPVHDLLSSLRAF